MPLFPRAKLAAVFKKTLRLQPDIDFARLKYNSVKAWDSVGHMTLVTALETEFEVMLDTDDVLEMSSFSKSIEILGKHGIEFEP